MWWLFSSKTLDSVIGFIKVIQLERVRCQVSSGVFFWARLLASKEEKREYLLKV